MPNSKQFLFILAVFLLSRSVLFSQELAQFSSESQNFSFTHPKNWTVELDSLIGNEDKVYYYTVILFSPEFHKTSGEEKIKSSEYVTISVDVSELTANGKKLNAERKNMVATVEEMRRILELPELEVIERKGQLLGKKAFMLTHPLHYGEEHQIFTISRDKKYLVSIRGSKKLSERYFPIFESISNSLEVL